MVCKKCKTKNEDGAAYCRNCGAALEQKAHMDVNRKKKLAAALAAVAVILAAGLILVPFLYKNAFREDAVEYAALPQTYALGEYESEYKTLDAKGTDIIQNNSFGAIPKARAAMKELTEKIVTWNEDNAAKFEQEYPSFQSLDQDYVLGTYEQEYQKLRKEADTYLDSVDYIGISGVLEPVETLTASVKEMNARVAEYKTAYDDTVKAFELLHMDSDEKEEYHTYLGQLEGALERFDVSACETAAAQLTDYQKQIEELNVSQIAEMRTAVDAFDTGELLEAEEGEFTQAEDAAKDLYSKKNYAEAYAKYQVCTEQIDLVERSWQYGIDLEQVDISDFPKVKLYLSIRDFTDDTYLEDLDADAFHLMESTGAGYGKTDILSAVKMDGKEKLNVAMVADCSASMGDDFYYGQEIMDSFVDSLQTGAGDRAALYSFADYVNREMYFTSDTSALSDAVYGMEMGDMTALYDALAFSLSEIVVQDGAKCVIAFTDGAENYSTSSKQFVIQKANEYHIPIYLIGIGYYVDDTELRDIAESTGGFYVNIDDISYMEDVYDQIYRDQKSMYVVQYQTDSKAKTDVARNIYISYNDDTYGIRMQDAYVPSEYKINGFIFYDSDKRYLTESELDQLTEAEVRIALNEIYARRGYKFTKGADMIQHFNNCSWYHGTEEDMQKVAAEFNEYEKKNVDLLVNYECKHGLNGRVQ